MIVGAVLVVVTACGGGTSDSPDSTETTVSQDSLTGVGDAIDRTREVADQAEERANSIDDLAP